MLSTALLSKVRHLEIRTRRLVNDLFAGEYHSVFKGQGLEFTEVRPYYAGDDVRLIDWNVSARARRLHVKRFQEERELTVLLAVDMSGSVDFGSGAQAKGEVAAELCALIAFCAIRNNDKVGLLIFTDRNELFIPPKKGRMQGLRVIREVLAFRAQHRRTDIAQAAEYVTKALTRRAIVFLVSDFMAEGFERPLGILGRKHDVIAVTIEDPREQTLPDVGLLELEDAETGRPFLLDTHHARGRAAYARRMRARREQLAELFPRLGVDHILIDTGQSHVEPLVRFFKERARRRR